MRIVYYVHFSLVIKEYNFTYISTCVYYVQVQLYLHIICTLLNAYCVMCCLYTSTKHIKLKFCTCKCIIFIFNSFLTLDQYFLLYQLQSYWEALGDFSNHVDKVLVTVQCSSIVQQYSEQCCRPIPATLILQLYLILCCMTYSYGAQECYVILVS